MDTELRVELSITPKDMDLLRALGIAISQRNVAEAERDQLREQIATELDTIEESLRLAVKERDELRVAIKSIHAEVSGDEPFYSWQRVYQDIRRLKATKWN